MLWLIVGVLTVGVPRRFSPFTITERNGHFQLEKLALDK